MRSALIGVLAFLCGVLYGLDTWRGSAQSGEVFTWNGKVYKTIEVEVKE